MFTITILIPPSRSASYGQVVAAAKRTGCYDPATRLLTIRGIPQVWRWWNDFTLIFWQAQKWSGFQVTVNAQPIIPHGNHTYYALQNIKYCYGARQESGDDGFCSAGCFGCRQLRTFPRFIHPGVSDYQAWYNYGKFTAQNVWTVDREGILRQLMREADLSLARFCPSFDATRVRKTIDDLPAVIRIGKYWKVRYRLDVGSDGPIRVVDGITYDFEEPMEHEEDLCNRVITQKETPASDPTDVDKLLDDILAKRKRKQ